MRIESHDNPKIKILQKFKVAKCFKGGKIFLNNAINSYEVFSGPYFPVFGLNTEIYVAIFYHDSKRYRNCEVGGGKCKKEPSLHFKGD